MKTIIVPTDFSPESEAALDVAAQIARPFNATLVLLHSVVYPVSMPAYADAAASLANPAATVFHDAEVEAEDALETLLKKEKYAGLKLIPQLMTDGEGLVRDVTEFPADLIVMSSKGSSGLKELFFGSNAESVVRYAHCPVLIIKEPIAQFQPSNVVCAIDVDEAFKTIPRYPFEFSKNAVAQFLYVMVPSDSRNPREIRSLVNDLTRLSGISDSKFVIQEAHTVPQGIISYAETVKADLIVLFTHGYTGLRHMVLGSVAEDVLNHSPLPVLVMRA